MNNTKFDRQKNAKAKLLEDAWMLDYFDKADGRWVRSPFLTWNQVIWVLTDLTHKKDRNRMEKMYSETFEDVDWGQVRIHSERELDVMVDEDGNEENSYSEEEEYMFVPVRTKRAHLFGDMYQNLSQLYREGDKHSAALERDIPKHALKDPDLVIEDLRYDYPDGVDWNKYDADQLCIDAMLAEWESKTA